MHSKTENYAFSEIRALKKSFWRICVGLKVFETLKPQHRMFVLLKSDPNHKDEFFPSTVHHHDLTTSTQAWRFNTQHTRVRAVKEIRDTATSLWENNVMQGRKFIMCIMMRQPVSSKNKWKT